MKYARQIKLCLLCAKHVQHDWLFQGTGSYEGPYVQALCPLATLATNICEKTSK